MESTLTKASPALSILVPLDGSTLAEQALPLATRIAQRTGSKLRLGLVHQPPVARLDTLGPRAVASLDLAIRKTERSYLRGVQARLREQGVRLSSAVVLTGTVGPAIATYVSELGIDLVVMATHGRGGLRRAWLGSVADSLIRHLEVPVLLVRPAEDGGSPRVSPKADQILVPLDGSPLAENALNPAARLAPVWNAELTLLQVVVPVPLPTDLSLPIPTQYDAELTALSRTQAQDYLDSAADRLRGDGLRVTAAAVIGWNPAETILSAAGSGRVRMVALATHGRSGLRRLMLGSVADKLVRGADVPVLVYRSGARAGRKQQRPRARRVRRRAR